MIDLEKLRSFYYVIKEGSLVKAAKVLDKNHTTLSKHLTDLETSHNVKLFVRKRKRLELTEKGNELFTLAQNTIPNLENGATEILSTNSMEPHPDRLRILTTGGATGVWLMRNIKRLMEEFPTLSPSIITTNAEIDLEASRADIGILPKFPGDGLSFKRLRIVRHGLYATPTYLKKHGVPKTLDDLKDHKLISYYSAYEGNMGNVDWHLSRGMPHNTLRESYFSVNSCYLLFEIGCQDMGIIPMMQGFEYLGDSKLIRILPEEESPKFELCFVTRTDSVLTPPQKRLLELLSEETK